MNHHRATWTQELVGTGINQEKTGENANNNSDAAKAVRKHLKRAAQNEQDGEQDDEGAALAERRCAVVAGFAYHRVQKNADDRIGEKDQRGDGIRDSVVQQKRDDSRVADSPNKPHSE